MEPLKIVFMGTPEFSATTLKYLIANQCEIIAVYTQQDKAAGRGRAVAASPVKSIASEAGIPVVQPRNFRKPATALELAAMRPDLVIVAAYGQILPQAILDVPRYGCLNVHPSLLPKYRGVSPVASAILAGDEFSGVSVMLLDAGTDTGPVLAQAQVPITAADTTGLLSDKLARIGAQLVVSILPSWVKGHLTPRPQNAALASYCHKLNKEDGEIDWGLPASEIWRRVRAYNPWPCAYTAWQGKQLKILEAKPVPAIAGALPGQVVDVHDKPVGFGIATGEGTLGISIVQLEGKKAMAAGDFLRGQRGLLGAMLRV